MYEYKLTFSNIQCSLQVDYLKTNGDSFVVWELTMCQNVSDSTNSLGLPSRQHQQMLFKLLIYNDFE